MAWIFSLMAVFLLSILTACASMAWMTDWSLGSCIWFGFVHRVVLVELVDDANVMPVGEKIRYGLVLSNDWLGRMMGKLSLVIGLESAETVSLMAILSLVFFT